VSNVEANLSVAKEHQLFQQRPRAGQLHPVTRVQSLMELNKQNISYFNNLKPVLSAFRKV